LSAPYLGSLSDKIGRRPVLLISILSTSLGWFIFALAPNVLFLFLGRIVDGMAAGNITTAQNYLVDIAKTPKERASNLGLIGAAFGIGFIIGPLLGGLLSSFSPSIPFFTVGFLALANVILAWFYLPETNPSRDRKKKISFNPLIPLKKASENKTLRPLYFAWLLFSFGISSMQAVFALYVADQFGFGSVAAGLFFTLFGLVVAFNQGFALKRFWLKYFKESNLILWLLPLVFLGFILISVPYLWFFILGQVALSFGQSVFRVVMSSEVISNVSQDVQGETLGIMNSLMSLSMVVAPIISGFIYEKKINAPFLLSALATLVAFFIIRHYRKNITRLKPIEENITSV
jgi:DHA1 family tetracycline resistance protein-like MFS transporter